MKKKLKYYKILENQCQANMSASFVQQHKGHDNETDKTYQDLLVWIELEKNIFERKLRAKPGQNQDKET